MTSSDGFRGSKALGVLVWVLVAFQALALGGAGASKFFAAEMWTDLFQGWGYPASLSYVVGVLEVAGAALLLIPRFSSWAALFLAGIMVVAAGTLLLSGGGMSPLPAIVNLVLLAVIARARWSARVNPV